MSTENINNRLLLENNRRRKNKDTFNHKPKKRLLFYPLKRTAYDDTLWEYDSRRRQRQVNFNFGNNSNSSKHRSKSEDSTRSDYMTLSSIHKRMSAGNSQENLRRSNNSSVDGNLNNHYSDWNMEKAYLKKARNQGSCFNFKKRPTKSREDKVSDSTYSNSSQPTERESWVEYSIVPTQNSAPMPRNIRIDQKSTDFGYWKHKNYAPTLNSYSLNTKENRRALQLPDLYSYDYAESSKLQSRKNQDTWRKWDISRQNNQFNRSFSHNSSNSSILIPENIIEMSPNVNYSRLLPVGKFARQKFNINREEEEMGNRPDIRDAAGNRITLRTMQENQSSQFENVSESVSMDICDLRNVQIIIDIDIEKYFYSKSEGRNKEKKDGWIKKRIMITRVICVDFIASGHSRELQRMIAEEESNQPLDYPQIGSYKTRYAVNGSDCTLSGPSAVKVYQFLMDVANDKWIQTDATRFSETRNQFTPQYLIAAISSNNNNDNDDASVLYF